MRLASTRRRRVVALLGLVCVVTASPGTAQRGPSGGTPPGVDLAVRVLPDTVTVGDSIRAVVRIRVPVGSTAEWDDFAPYDTTVVQLLAPPEILAASPGDGRADPVAVIHAVAWRTGALPALTGRIRIVPADGEATTVPVTLAMPHVRSVLPADTAGVRPRGPKDVLGASYDWRRLALAALGVLLVLLLLFAVVRWVARRVRRGPRRDPRREALRELDALRSADGLDAAEFYARLSATLRRFVAATRREWGTELTTTELLARMATDRMPAEGTGPLAEALTAADLAKFARIRPTAEDAARHLAAVRAWVASADFAIAEPAEEEETTMDHRAAAEVAR